MQHHTNLNPKTLNKSKKRKDTMKPTDAQTVIDKLTEAVYFSICYKPKKYKGRPIYRNAKWDEKCKIGNGYIIYYDRDRGGYRCASGESAISIGQGDLNNG